MQTLGEIRMFAGNFAPQGWMFCNGTVLSIAENDALYSLIGTTYGGDGQVTFALPDLRSRAPIHMGQGPGLSNRTLGETIGSETVTLNSNQLPFHYHPVSASNTPGTLSSPSGNVWAPGSTGERQYTGVTTLSMSDQCTTPTGGNQPHENMMPFLAVSFIIAVEGIYPSRS